MKEKPILFNGDMVRAVLDGSKTQTRRIVKPQPWRFCPSNTPRDSFDMPIKCPYGVTGDRLWVRETHAITEHGSWTKCNKPIQSYTAINERGRRQVLNKWNLIYRATQTIDPDYPVRWRPSIHMPRWASRITLEVVSVKVERVKGITYDDAIAEGLYREWDGTKHWYGEHSEVSGLTPYPTVAFQNLWDSINGKPRKNGADISWYANPWVWVVEFKLEDK